MNKAYKFFTKLLGPFYKFYYKPKIMGIENLEKCQGKGVIIASNHIHLFDQNNIIISTKEIIHYLAKQEYFDSWKTRWFVKLVGCIPVKRNGQDEEATHEAIDILKNKGTVGIFPEGTRNQYNADKLNKTYEYFKDDFDKETFIAKVKDEYPSQINLLIELVKKKKISKEEMLANLDKASEFLQELVLKKKIKKRDYLESCFLDFKYGAVSMAKKTGSYIIPVVVKGKYEFRGNTLEVRIGLPFKVDDMDLKEANKLLRDKMIDMLNDRK